MPKEASRKVMEGFRKVYLGPPPFPTGTVIHEGVADRGSLVDVLTGSDHEGDGGLDVNNA